MSEFVIKLLNSMQLRLASVLAVLFLSSLLSPTSWQPTLHLFAFSFWFGMSMWVSFVAGIVMFRSLPKRTFGIVQSKLFPRYFESSTALVIICAATLPEVFRTRNTYIVLFVALAACLSNLFIIEPATSSVMLQRHKLEDELGLKTNEDIKKAAETEPRMKALNKRFGMLHGISSLANLLALGCSSWHLALIGKALGSV